MIKHLKPERFSRSKPLQLPRPARGFEREKCDPLPMKFSEEPNEDLLRLPLLAANGAPAAICCFLDFAGMMLSFQAFSQPEPIEGV